MKELSDLLKFGKSTLALIPGLVVISFNLFIPVGISRILLGGFIEAFAVFTLLFFAKPSQQFKSYSPTKIKKIAVVFFILFILSFISYSMIYTLNNIYVSKYNTTLLMPFWESNNLQYMIAKTGSINNAILAYGPEQIRQSINEKEWSIGLTELIFTFNYILIFEFLTISFCLISIKKSSSPPQDRARVTRVSKPAEAPR